MTGIPCAFSSALRCDIASVAEGESLLMQSDNIFYFLLVLRFYFFQPAKIHKKSIISRHFAIKIGRKGQKPVQGLE